MTPVVADSRDRVTTSKAMPMTIRIPSNGSEPRSTRGNRLTNVGNFITGPGFQRSMTHAIS
jgi:hypothetical protein